jgi:hypothetical protein
MSFDAWLITFQDARQAARAAYERAEQLAVENAELRQAAQWHSAGTRPPVDADLLVLLETSDGEVYPGFADGERWYYADGVPVSSVEVLAWRHLPPARTKQAE